MNGLRIGLVVLCIGIIIIIIMYGKGMEEERNDRKPMLMKGEERFDDIWDIIHLFTLDGSNVINCRIGIIGKSEGIRFFARPEDSEADRWKRGAVISHTMAMLNLSQAIVENDMTFYCSFPLEDFSRFRPKDDEADYHPSAWVSTRRVITNGHYDVSTNKLVHLWGQKRVILFPPGHFGRVYPYPHVHARQVMESVELVVKGGGIVFDLEPGDVLFIPPYWFHWVFVTSEHAVSVSLHAPSEEEQAFGVVFAYLRQCSLGETLACGQECDFPFIYVQRWQPLLVGASKWQCGKTFEAVVAADETSACMRSVLRLLVDIPLAVARVGLMDALEQHLYELMGNNAECVGALLERQFIIKSAV